VVPDPSYEHSLIVQFDAGTGRVVAEAPISAVPAGIAPIHQRYGWVGLSEGEGQDATRAWWVRKHPAGGQEERLELMDGGWDDWVLSDVDPSGTRVITTPHTAGPMIVRAFPGLEPLRVIAPPDDEHQWDFAAAFIGDHIVAHLIGRTERLVAIDADGACHDLEEDSDGLVPAASDSWLAVGRDRLRRMRLT
jgi:hypothetical protein